MLKTHRSTPKRVLGFTSIRSDYDLLSYFYSLLHKDKSIDFRLIVSGAHLSKSYGLSIEQILHDKLPILANIETLIDSDTKKSRAKTASILFQNAIDIVSQFSPDLIVYAGDREDAAVAALIGGYLCIPTIHFFGGDHASDGNIDNPVRHAVSKLSTVHFVSHEQHAKRLLRIGEPSNRIFSIGSVALDKFVHHTPITIARIKNIFSIQSGFNEFALLIYHPIISESETAFIEFENIIKSLLKLNICVFISSPNTDAGNKNIIDVIARYRDNPMIKTFKNLERDLFLSIFKNAQFIIGNSSSGIVEAASIPIPAINVGSRQRGRVADKNVVFCDGNSVEIEKAIRKVRSDSFLKVVANVKNSYGNGNSSIKAFKLIKTINFQKILYKSEDPLIVK